MKVKEFLNEENWHQGSDAADTNGMPVPASSDKAAKFCVLGAIARCYDRQHWYEIASKCRSIISSKSNGYIESISSFNDNADSFDVIRELLEEADV